MEDYLAHHGIEGQKWGVRNGPPYPLDPKVYKKAQYTQRHQNFKAKMGYRDERYRERHVIPAGTTMYRTTVDENEQPHEAMYVSYLDPDRYAYRGGWVRNTAKAEDSYENRYTLQKDLVVPGRDELSKVIRDVVRKDPELMRETAHTWVRMFSNPLTPILNRTPSVDFINELISDIGDKPASQMYYVCAQTFGLNTELRDRVIKELKGRGYNAMTDEASVGGKTITLPGKKRFARAKHGVDPLIIFDGADTLQKNKTERISRLSEGIYGSKQQSWMKKAAMRGKNW